MPELLRVLIHRILHTLQKGEQPRGTGILGIILFPPVDPADISISLLSCQLFHVPLQLKKLQVWHLPHFW